MAVRSQTLKPVQKIKTKSNDLKLGFASHALQGMKTVFAEKMVLIRVVLF